MPWQVQIRGTGRQVSLAVNGVFVGVDFCRRGEFTIEWGRVAVVEAEQLTADALRED